MGFTGYYQRFIHNYAQIATPLFALIGGKRGTKDPPFTWSVECQQAFTTLKQKMTSTPVLAYADYSLPFTVQTDASADGFGAVLAQEQDGRERPIAYASRTLTASEAKYPAHKLEFCALHWAITVKFWDYLYGQDVTAVTDNNPLTYVLKKAKLDAHGQRWVSDLSQFKLDIIYRPGHSNCNAHALSRIVRDEVLQIFGAKEDREDNSGDKLASENKNGGEKEQAQMNAQEVASPREGPSISDSESDSTLHDNPSQVQVLVRELTSLQHR